MRHLFLSALTAGSLFISAVASHAQTYDISWHAIAGGGGTSSNGTYSVSGTIGQPATATLSGNGYSLTGGFWSILSVVQTPGAPLLSIIQSSAGQVTLAWPVTSTGFTLQQEPNLATPSWASINTNTYPIVVTNGNNTIILPVSGNQYFRLSNAAQ